jgi:hypothetical protein
MIKAGTGKHKIETGDVVHKIKSVGYQFSDETSCRKKRAGGLIAVNNSKLVNCSDCLAIMIANRGEAKRKLMIMESAKRLREARTT